MDLGRNAVWVTWDRQPRNRSMANLIGIELYELICRKRWFLRYPILIAKTTSIISKRHVTVVFVQNPSMVLALYAALIKKIFRYTLIVDFHNAGIYPFEGKSRILNILAKHIVRLCDLSIVSNNSLAKQVHNWKGRPFVFPDPIPTFNLVEEHRNDGEKYVLFICTWAADEPFKEVIQAAKYLVDHCSIYITGNFTKVLNKIDQELVPENVKLLGYVTEAEYVGYFRSASVALDLTKRESCLVCGAYEAISLGIPMIVSDDKESRSIFNKGFVFTENEPKAIAEAIKHCLENRLKYSNDIKRLREERLVIDEICKNHLLYELGEM